MRQRGKVIKQSLYKMFQQHILCERESYDQGFQFGDFLSSFF